MDFVLKPSTYKIHNSKNFQSMVLSSMWYMIEMLLAVGLVMYSGKLTVNHNASDGYNPPKISGTHT